LALAFVNSTSGASDAGATTVAATAASHTAANLLVVHVGWSNNVTLDSIADTAGNTYTRVASSKANNGTTDHVETFHAKSITGNASNAVTAAFSASATFRRIIVHQYSGADTSAPADVAGSGNVAAATSITSSSFTTNVADEVISAAMGSTGAATSIPAAGTSYTLRVSNLGNDSHSEDRIVNATNSYTASFTWATGTQDAWITAATFKQAGAAATPMPPLPVVVDFAVARAASY
jgi:hypothetical protein